MLVNLSCFSSNYVFLTKAVLVLRAGIFSKRRKGPAINLLVGRFHTKHCLRAAVALLSQIVDDLNHEVESVKRPL